MKLVYLELEEEITSVIDKLQRAPAADVFLVIPKRANLLQSLVNLKLLKKHAAMLGKKVVIVTADTVGLNLAQRAGLTARPRVDSSVDDAEADEVDLRSRKKPEVLRVRSYREIQRPATAAKKKSPSLGQVRTQPGQKRPRTVSLISRRRVALTLIIVLGVLLAGAAYVYFYLPQAKITLHLKTEIITNDVRVTIAENVVTPDVQNNQIPGVRYEIELTDSQQAAATGEKDVGRKAQGTITLYNTYQTTPRTIGPSEFKAASGQQFRSLETVTLPGYTDTGGGNKVPGTATVAVEADEGGESYNIGPTNFSLPALEAKAQKDIYGKSSTAMVGGTSEKAKIVSEDDLQKAEAVILDRMKNKAVSEYRDPENVTVAEGSRTEILDYGLVPAKDERADNFTLKITARLSFLAFRVSDLKAVAADDLKNILPADKFVISEEANDGTFDLAEDRIADGSMVLFYHEQKRFTPTLAKEVIKQEVSGLNKDEIMNRLSTRDNVQGVDVDFWPFWVKQAPSDPRRTSVEIELD